MNQSSQFEEQKQNTPLQSNYLDQSENQEMRPSPLPDDQIDLFDEPNLHNGHPGRRSKNLDLQARKKGSN